MAGLRLAWAESIDWARKECHAETALSLSTGLPVSPTPTCSFLYNHEEKETNGTDPIYSLHFNKPELSKLVFDRKNGATLVSAKKKDIWPSFILII
jgi:hypothetical protein